MRSHGLAVDHAGILRPRWLAVLAGLVVAVATACSSSPPDTGKPAGSTARATTQTHSARPTGRPEPKLDPGTSESSTFDECALLDPGVLARATREQGWALTYAAARRTDPGWTLTCGYDHRPRLPQVEGFDKRRVELELRTRQPSNQPDPSARPVPALGEKGWEYDQPGMHVVQSEKSDVTLTVKVAEAEPTGKAGALAAIALRRLPGTVVVNPRRVDGPCAQVNSKYAGEVLQDSLLGVRGLVFRKPGEGWSALCTFGGQTGKLQVQRNFGPRAEQDFTLFQASGQVVPGFGAKVIRLGTVPLSRAVIRTPAAVIRIDTTYPRSTTKYGHPQLTGGEAAFLRTVIGALG